MHEIVLKYQKGGRHWSQKAFCPSTWMEVTPQQARQILPTILSSPMTETAQLFVFRKLVTGVAPSAFLGLSSEQIFDILQCVNWLWQEDLSYPIIDQVRVRRGLKYPTYYMPKEKLENLTCFEFWVADEYYQKYLETREQADLDLLVATLLREPAADKKAALRQNDVREKLYSRQEIQARSKRLKKMDKSLKLYVLMYFSGCKNWLFEQFGDLIFELPEEEEEEANEVAEEDENPLGWYGLFQKAAESAVFGDLSNILYNVKFLDFCTYLVAKRLEHDKMQRAIEKQRAMSELQ